MAENTFAFCLNQQLKLLMLLDSTRRGSSFSDFPDFHLGTSNWSVRAKERHMMKTPSPRGKNADTSRERPQFWQMHRPISQAEQQPLFHCTS